MPGFGRDARGTAVLGGVRLSDLLAEPGQRTPAYVYDLGAICAGARELLAALGERNVLAYALKANTAGSIVRALAGEGVGAALVSGAELEVALACGVLPERMVMNGVAKSDAEIDLAIASNIRALQVESVEEIERIAARSRALSSRARVALRINPNVLIDSHAKIATGHDAAKFGVPLADLGEAWTRIDARADTLSAIGVSTHIGSMVSAPDPYLESAKIVCSVARARLAAGKTLDYINFGGGFSIDYGSTDVRPPSEFARAALALLEQSGLSALSLFVEPGRSLVGPHGVLLSRVIQAKVSAVRRFVMLDAGMNDLMRPALYGARHRIEPLEREPGSLRWRVVGPVCESSDDFGEHTLGDTPPKAVVIRDAGAYGFVMASEYNGRGMPDELFVSDGRVVKVSRSSGAAAWVRRRLDA